MKRRVLSAILGLALFLAFLPAAPVLAANDYPYQNMTYGRYSAEDLDPWKFYYRECTSFVAWRLNNDNGLEFDDFYGGVQWGNGREWGPAARALGIRVDDVPAVGAVYWQDAYFHCSASGHVGWVKALNGDGTVVIEHYAAGSYKEVTVPVGYASGYIHIKDLDAHAPDPAGDELRASLAAEPAAPAPEKGADEAADKAPAPEKGADEAGKMPDGGKTFSEVHFQKVSRELLFTDVPEDAWYASSVADVLAYRLMEGDSATSFRPEGKVTIAEAIVLASRIYRGYTGISGSFTEIADGPWYLPYLVYALEQVIVDPEFCQGDLGREATRAEFARIFSAALPEEALAPINTVEAGSIPDVDAEAPYAAAVYRLYEAGILTGGSGGAFQPENPITRAETAAIVARMADSGNRVLIP